MKYVKHMRKLEKTKIAEIMTITMMTAKIMENAKIKEVVYIVIFMNANIVKIF